MGSACGVSWDGTSSGELDESAIPNDDYESHYLNAGDTKSDSSFPVVDGDGNLRAGNVDSAWDMRNRGEGVSEECLRKLDNAFDDDVLPESAYENTEFAAPSFPDFEEGMMVEWQVEPDWMGMIVSIDDEKNILMVELMEETDDGMEPSGFTLTAGYTDVRPVEGEMPDMANEMSTEYSSETVTLDEDDDGSYEFHVDFATPRERVLGDGFNEHGVRVNDDGSVDVRFRAMEPGTRRGMEVTQDFLTNVVSHEYGEVPVQLDHSKSQMANVGVIKPDNMEFVDGGLHLQAHFPNTGSSVREDVIADFTHDPPQIRDGSIGFDPQSVEVRKPDKRGDNIEFVDAQIREFSLTPFPAGYDDGGLTPEFSEAVEDAVFDDTDDDCGCGEKSDSQLTTYSHNLIRTNYD